MEDIEIEYLDEYKDIVLPGIKTSDARNAGTSAEQTSSRLNKSRSDSSSIDADMFIKLLDGKFLDDDLLNDSGSNQKEKSRRLSSSSSSDSNDALDVLYNRQGSSTKDKRRNRLRSFDSIDDLGEALMGPAQNSILQELTGSQLPTKKPQNEGLIKSSKLNAYKPSSSTASKPKIKTDNFKHVARNNNRTSSSSSSSKVPQFVTKKKPVCIIKSQKSAFKPSKYEPKEDPLDFQDSSDELDSDSSYEFESDFYEDGDTDEEDTPGPTYVINTSSDSDTVSPVISDDEEGGSQHHNNEHLHLYLNNLSSAETPPSSIFNEHESTDLAQKQVNDTASQALAEAEEPTTSTSCHQNVKDSEKTPQDDFVDSSLTYDRIERLTLDITEQINTMDAELSFEFEKRAESKPRSLSHSTGLSHVRKPHNSNSNALRRTKSEIVFPKRGRGRPPKKRNNTTEEQSKSNSQSPKKGVEKTTQKPNNESNSKTPSKPSSRKKKITKKLGRPRKKDLKQNFSETKTTISKNSTEHASENPSETDSKTRKLVRVLETGSDFSSVITQKSKILPKGLLKSQEPVTFADDDAESVRVETAKYLAESKIAFESIGKLVETSAGQCIKLMTAKSPSASHVQVTDAHAADTDKTTEIESEMTALANKPALVDEQEITHELENSDIEEKQMEFDEQLSKENVSVGLVVQAEVEHSAEEATEQSIKQTEQTEEKVADNLDKTFSEKDLNEADASQETEIREDATDNSVGADQKHLINKPVYEIPDEQREGTDDNYKTTATDAFSTETSVKRTKPKKKSRIPKSDQEPEGTDDNSILEKSTATDALATESPVKRTKPKKSRIPKPYQELEETDDNSMLESSTATDALATESPVKRRKSKKISTILKTEGTNDDSILERSTATETSVKIEKSKKLSKNKIPVQQPEEADDNITATDALPTETSVKGEKTKKSKNKIRDQQAKGTDANYNLKKSTATDTLSTLEKSTATDALPTGTSVKKEKPKKLSSQIPDQQPEEKDGNSTLNKSTAADALPTGTSVKREKPKKLSKNKIPDQQAKGTDDNFNLKKSTATDALPTGTLDKRDRSKKVLKQITERTDDESNLEKNTAIDALSTETPVQKEKPKKVSKIQIADQKLKGTDDNSTMEKSTATEAFSTGTKSKKLSKVKIPDQQPEGTDGNFTLDSSTATDALPTETPNQKEKSKKLSKNQISDQKSELTDGNSNLDKSTATDALPTETSLKREKLKKILKLDTPDNKNLTRKTLRSDTPMSSSTSDHISDAEAPRSESRKLKRLRTTEVDKLLASSGLQIRRSRICSSSPLDIKKRKPFKTYEKKKFDKNLKTPTKAKLETNIDEKSPSLSESTKEFLSEKPMCSTELSTPKLTSETDQQSPTVSQTDNIKSSASNIDEKPKNETHLKHVQDDLVEPTIKADLLGSTEMPDTKSSIEITTDDQNVNKVDSSSDNKLLEGVQIPHDNDKEFENKESAKSNKADIKITQKKTNRKLFTDKGLKKQKPLNKDVSKQNTSITSTEKIQEDKQVISEHDEIKSIESVNENTLLKTACTVPDVKESTTNELTSIIDTTTKLDTLNVNRKENQLNIAVELITNVASNKDQANSLDASPAAPKEKQPTKEKQIKQRIRKTYLQIHLDDLKDNGLEICQSRWRSSRSKTKTPDVAVAKRVQFKKIESTEKFLSEQTASKPEEVSENTHSVTHVSTTTEVETVLPVDTKDNGATVNKEPSTVVKSVTETALPTTPTNKDISLLNMALLKQTRKLRVRIKRLKFGSIGCSKQRIVDQKEPNETQQINTETELSKETEIDVNLNLTEQPIQISNEVEKAPNQELTNDKTDNAATSSNIQTSFGTPDKQVNNPETLRDLAEPPTLSPTEANLVTEEFVAKTLAPAEEKESPNKDSIEKHMDISMEGVLAEFAEEPVSSDQLVDQLDIELKMLHGAHSESSQGFDDNKHFGTEAVDKDKDENDNASPEKENKDCDNASPEKEKEVHDYASPEKEKKENDNASPEKGKDDNANASQEEDNDNANASPEEDNDNANASPEEIDLLYQLIENETTGVTSVDIDNDKGDKNSVSLARSLRKREADATKSDALEKSKLMLQTKQAKSINIMAPPAPPKRELATGKAVLRRLGKDLPGPQHKRRKVEDPLDDDANAPGIIDCLSVLSQVSRESPKDKRTKSTSKNTNKSLPKETAKNTNLTQTSLPVIGKLNVQKVSPVKSKLSTFLGSDMPLAVDNSVIITKTPIKREMELVKKLEVQPTATSGINISILVVPDNNANKKTTVSPSKTFTPPAAVKKLSGSKKTPGAPKITTPLYVETVKKPAVLTAAEKQLLLAKISKNQNINLKRFKVVDNAEPAVVKKLPLEPSRVLEDKQAKSANNVVTRKSRQGQTKETTATTSAAKAEQTDDKPNEKIETSKLASKTPKKSAAKTKEPLKKAAATETPPAATVTTTEILETSAKESPIQTQKSSNEQAKRLPHISETPANRASSATRATTATETPQQQSAKQIAERMEPKPQRPSRRSQKVAVNTKAPTEPTTPQKTQLLMERFVTKQTTPPALLVLPKAVSSPSKESSQQPTEQPKQGPTKLPTKLPTKQPTEQPKQGTTKLPTKLPTKPPTEQPTQKPAKLLVQQSSQRSAKQSRQQSAERPIQQPTKRLSQTSAESQSQPSSAYKRKLSVEETAVASKRAKEQTTAPIAFPVRIMAATETAQSVLPAAAQEKLLPTRPAAAAQPVNPVEATKSNGSSLTRKLLPTKQKKLCVRLSRSIVKKWLEEQKQQKQVKQTEPPAAVEAIVIPTIIKTLEVAAKVTEAAAINKTALVQKKPAIQQPVPAKSVPLPLPLIEVKTEQEDIEMAEQQQQQQPPPALELELPPPPPPVLELPLPPPPVLELELASQSTELASQPPAIATHTEQMELEVADVIPPAAAIIDNNLTPASSLQNATQQNNLNLPSSSSSVSNSSMSLASSAVDTHTFGTTRMFSFLHPSRYHQSYGNVALEFCCPNLDGPMPAIDPTRLHSKVEAPVLELPQYMVISTRFITRQDKNIPQKVRAKLEELAAKEALPNVMQEALNTANVAAATKLTATPTVVQTVAQPVATAAVLPLPTPVASSLPVAATQAAMSNIDRLNKQLPRGTVLTPKLAPPTVAVAAPAATIAVKAATSVPNLLQLPPIFPADKQRLELQTRVQLLDVALQNLIRQAATMTIEQRKLVIENIVRTSTLLPIDVDMGTKFLENYGNYINEVTKTILPPTPRLRTVITPVTPTCTTNASNTSNSTPQSKPFVAARAAPTISTSATSGNESLPQLDGQQPCRRIYDKNNQVIGYQYQTPKLSLNKASPAAAVKGLVGTGSPTVVGAQPQRPRLQLVPNVHKDYAVSINAPNNTLDVSSLTPAAAAAAHTSKRLGNISQNTLSPLAEPQGFIGQIGTTNTASNSHSTITPSTAESLTHTEHSTPCNLFIVNQVLSQQEECILPDGVSTTDASALTTEIKGELDDAENLT